MFKTGISLAFIRPPRPFGKVTGICRLVSDGHINIHAGLVVAGPVSRASAFGLPRKAKAPSGSFAFRCGALSFDF
jgi:hypothetical protein